MEFETDNLDAKAEIFKIRLQEVRSQLLNSEDSLSLFLELIEQMIDQDVIVISKDNIYCYKTILSKILLSGNTEKVRSTARHMLFYIYNKAGIYV